MSLDLIDRFEAGGALLNYAVGGLTRDQETARPGPGAWSIAELAAHLADSDLVATDRMKRVIAEDRPVLLAYDENAWVARLAYQDQPATEAAALFAANRRWTARVLRRLDEADFARVGQHTEHGPLTLAELLATYVGHLDHHLRFLYAKRANLGVSLYPRYSANDAGRD
jgi:uncharacterized damage-inducible protein DinB